MAATLLLQCRACSHEFRVPESLTGKRLNCPYCGTAIEVKAAQQNKDPLIGQTIRGCRLEKRLGAGAMGAVYEATYIKAGRRVAVKMLSSKAAESQELVRRFEREAKLCKQITHPNVVDVYDFGVDRTVHFMIMELVDGPSLAGLLETRERLPWREGAEIIKKVAEALADVSDQNIIHRDIKPANILIAKDGTPKLADLGLGKNLSDEDDYGLTMQGAAMGSPAYMPPEQITDASSVDQTADVYALGATFYHVVTGRRPFEAVNAAMMMSTLRTEIAPDPRSLIPSIPAGINDLIMQMIEKVPENRPQHAKELVVEIDSTIANPDASRVRKRKAPSQKRAEKNKSNGAGMWIGIGVVVLLAAAAAVYFLVIKGG